MTAIFEGFVFGLASSVHCAAMCGPLALAAGTGTAQVAAYHGGRLTGYVTAGGVLGAVGAAGGAGAWQAAAPWLAFLLAGGLVLGAFGLDRRLGALPGSSSLVRRALGQVRSWPAACRTAVLGGVTPLLPCGLLWALYGTALLAGSALAGGATTVGFAAGSAPLLLVAQTQGGRLRRCLRAEHAPTIVRLVFLTAAAVLVWRGVRGLSGNSCCG